MTYSYPEIPLTSILQSVSYYLLNSISLQPSSLFNLMCHPQIHNAFA